MTATFQILFGLAVSFVLMLIVIIKTNDDFNKRIADLDDWLTRLEDGNRQTLRRQTMELAELQRRLNGLTEVVVFNEKVQRLTDDALVDEVTNVR